MLFRRNTRIGMFALSEVCRLETGIFVCMCRYLQHTETMLRGMDYFAENGEVIFFYQVSTVIPYLIWDCGYCIINLTRNLFLLQTNCWTFLTYVIVAIVNFFIFFYWFLRKSKIPVTFIRRNILREKIKHQNFLSSWPCKYIPISSVNSPCFWTKEQTIVDNT